jgi:hypothetical protein
MPLYCAADPRLTPICTTWVHRGGAVSEHTKHKCLLAHASCCLQRACASTTGRCRPKGHSWWGACTLSGGTASRGGCTALILVAGVLLPLLLLAGYMLYCRLHTCCIVFSAGPLAVPRLPVHCMCLQAGLLAGWDAVRLDSGVRALAHLDCPRWLLKKQQRQLVVPPSAGWLAGWQLALQ